MSVLGDVRLCRVDSIDDIFELRRWLGERRDILGVDTETGGLEWWREPLRMVQFGDHRTGWAVDWERWSGAIIELLGAYDRPMAMHNAKFDAHFLERNGARFRRDLVHDTAVLARLAEPNRPAGLKDVCDRHIDPRASRGGQVLRQAMREHGWEWATVPADFLTYWAYGALDPVLTAHAATHYGPEVYTRYRRAYELELATTWALTDMERNGLLVDIAYARPAHDAYAQMAAELRTSVEAEWHVNPGSDQQVTKRLWADGCRWGKRTDSKKLACDEEVLSGLDHPLAAAVLRYRMALKFAESYFGNWVELADPDALLHPDIRQMGARTGRMSVARPSMQNLPRLRHLRNAFIPREGHRLVLADFDQIEMRLMAHFANETRMISAIRRGDELTEAGYPGFDVHSVNARAVYHIQEGEPIPAKQRSLVKNAGFAKIYGAGLEQFARTAKVPPHEAKDFLNAFDETYPGIKRFMREVEYMAAERLANEGVPYVIASDGRRLPSARTKTYALVNYLVQGTAAVVMKEAMRRIDAAGLLEHVVLPIHDEVLCDVPTEDVDEFSHELVRAMEDRDQFAVPLTAGVEAVDRWGEKYADD